MNGLQAQLLEDLLCVVIYNEEYRLSPAVEELKTQGKPAFLILYHDDVHNTMVLRVKDEMIDFSPSVDFYDYAQVRVDTVWGEYSYIRSVAQMLIGELDKKETEEKCLKVQES